VSADRFFRNPRSGELVVAQAPNPPLVAFAVAEALRRWRPSAVTSALALGALAWWSYGEVTRGESPFRRVLGAVAPAGYLALVR
jgi:hypothetical protein